MKKQKIILDVDPGVDDSIAMIYGFLCDELDIKLVSVIGGNVDLNQCTLNALYITQNFAKYDVPVVKGSSKPLKKRMVHDLNVHGKKGLGNLIEVTSTQKKTINKRGFGACEAIRDVIMANKNEIIFVCLGPSTNLARTFEKYPDVIKFIKKVVLMGGSVDGTGSITKYAGFNVYSDPDACDMVVKSGVPITFSPKELGLNTFVTQPILEKWSSFNNVGDTVKKLYTGYHDLLLPTDKFATHDLCALMSLVRPQYYTSEQVDVSVNTDTGRKRGQTLFAKNDQSNITLLRSVDRKKVIKEFENKLKKA